MAEKDLSKMLMKKMKPFGHFVRIENMTGVGMPDVSYCVEGHEGFIENKWRERWPAKPSDVVTLDHFTPQQRIWIRSRCAAKGKVWVLLEVEKPVASYFLLPGLWAAQNLGKTATREDIETNATVKGRDGAFPLDSLLGAFRYW
jgi:hypothetical protein